MSNLKDKVGEGWFNLLSPILNSKEFKKNWEQIKQDYKSGTCYPIATNIFRAFELVKLKDLRVIVIGQDPYIDLNEEKTPTATGLAFDTNGKKVTPSLRKMYEGYSDEYPHNFYTDLMDGKLQRWCEHGIFLINTALTVQAGKSGSHTKYWGYFTEQLFRKINKIDKPILYVAWGKHAHIVVDNLVNNPKHQVVKASHPVSAVYKKGNWDSKGSFKKIESFIQEHYDKTFEWEPTIKLKK